MTDSTDTSTVFDSTRPAWATSHEDATKSDRSWFATLVADPNFRAELTRLDTYNRRTGRVDEGEVELMVRIDRNEAISFIHPDHLREAAQKLLLLANGFEAAIA